MASQAQIDANRANAQFSTGPKTEEGKAASSQNARRHGLLSSTPLYSSEEDNNDYNQLERSLRAECLPQTAAEEQAFLRYAFNSYQLIRAQRLEVATQNNFLIGPDDFSLSVMERLMKLTALVERRVDKALNELRKLQKDRFVALEIENEMYLLEKKAPIPVSLPVAEMAKTDLRKTNPFQLAVMILSTCPDLREIVLNQTKPIEDPPEEEPLAA